MHFLYIDQFEHWTFKMEEPNVQTSEWDLIFCILNLGSSYIVLIWKFFILWSGNYYQSWLWFCADTSALGKLDANSSVSFESEFDRQVPSERSHIIMQNFAKVIWNVLKQYNSKLKVIRKRKYVFLKWSLIFFSWFIRVLWLVFVDNPCICT